ncbi:MAG: aromatic-ring-hydroxylating dioxygenase subunit beta [Sinimarinibacterium flocculans]|uniref:aromatic-ring-hydroxylating dioxygenase subunit beta n=1 Tax=Sinimarinibacterium flocculans TaxID=985250 RepID=UPI003C5368B1
MANDATLAVKPDPAGSVPQEQYAPDAIWREAERLLYREARLLDTERLSDWLEQIVDPTVRYMVVSRELRFRKEKRYGQPAEVFMYDDDYDFLKARVEQFHSGMQWRVDPPERYRRLVTNIEVFETGKDGEFAARSNCLAVRTRRAYEIDQFVYCREDLLRRCPFGKLRLVQRRIDFDERSVAGRNLVMIL